MLSRLPNVLRSASPRWWVVACVILGVAVRFRHYAQNHSYWYDESYLLVNVFEEPFAALFGPLRYDLVIPALFLCLERICFLALGPAEWAMRLPAFVSSIAAILFMIPLARRVVGGWVAWLPVGFVALSRHALIHACEARPYSTDLLIAELILWCTVLLVSDVTSRVRTAAMIGLFLAAAVAPWLSFPSAFILGGAGAGLFVHALRTKKRADWIRWTVLCAMTLVSGAALWVVQARHLYYPTLHDHWGPRGWGGFPDLENPAAALTWPVRALVGVGQYGTAEMGIPLLVLAVLAVWRLVREKPALAAALVAPVVLALAAAYLRKYPLAERTGFFLLPVVWLTVAVGVRWVIERLGGRWYLALLPIALVGPDVVYVAKHLYKPPPFPPSREVFARIDAERTPDDAIFMANPELYRVYHGPAGEVLDYRTPPSEFMSRTAGRRVWMVFQPGPMDPATENVFKALELSGHKRSESKSELRIVVQLWLPTP